jgi:hypothetical protein
VNMPVTRKAIIIGAPGDAAPSSTMFLGVQADAVSYERFLLSPHGGAWTRGEILQLWHPDAMKLTEILNAITCDYSLTVFCGHGARYEGEPVIEVNPNEVMYVSGFRTRSKRQLTIIDACQVEMKSKVLLTEKVAGVAAPPDPYRQSCRDLYDAGIMAVGEMRALWNGCDIGQVSGSNPLGGYFSHTLLTTCESWASKARGLASAASEACTIREVHDVVGPRVTREHYPQAPTLESGRSHTSFPFVAA